MTWLNAPMLLGLLLVAIPVVLHLAMRQKPKPLTFPALRFVQQRQQSNKRSMRLRHWVLLLLRCLAIGLAVLLLARPSVASAFLGDWVLIGLLGTALLGVLALTIYSLSTRRTMAMIAPLIVVSVLLLASTLWILGQTLSAGSRVSIGDQEAPVSAVLLIDTSARMQLKHENQTRLETVQELAKQLIRELPLDSQIGVVDSGGGATYFAVDRSAALKSIDQLTTVGSPLDLQDNLVRATALAEQGEHRRKELFVFTDRTRAGWPAPNEKLKKTLEELPQINAVRD